MPTADDGPSAQTADDERAPLAAPPSELEACDWYHRTTRRIAPSPDEWAAGAFPPLRIHLEYSTAHLLDVVVDDPQVRWEFRIVEPVQGAVELQADAPEHTDRYRAYLRWALDQVGVRLHRG